MNTDNRKKLRTRVNRIAGQLAGIQRMLDEDRYCVDILHQIAAIRSALDSLGVELVSQHLESCILDHGGENTHDCARPMTQQQLLEEIRHALTQFLK